MQPTAGGRPSHELGDGWSRRDFLRLGGALAAGAAVAAVAGPALGAVETTPGFLTRSGRAILRAATARLVPASGPADWSAADLGAVDYIDNLLSGFDRDGASGAIYAGGPYRVAGDGGPGFSQFQSLSRVKSIGWRAQLERWRALYVAGTARLDDLAGGSFATAPVTVQDGILESLDLAGDDFFAALYDHTMEGVYGHPVYGGNRDYRAWQAFGFPGDVHGVRFPVTGSAGFWDRYGGFSPEEILMPGLPVARVTYSHHPNDLAVQAAAAPLITVIPAEMGAVSSQPLVPLGVPTAVPQIGDQRPVHRGPGRGAPATIGGLVNHQMGTMLMGSDPDSSVVDPDGRFWGIPNLYVADGSIFPTSGGYNPTLTIQAMAWRTADRVAAAHR